MEKVLKTNSGKEVKLASSAAFLYIYHNQFKEDPFEKLFAMVEDINEYNKSVLDNPDEERNNLEIMKHIDILFLSNLTWAMAKNANGTIDGPIEFYQANPDFLPLDHIEEIIELAMNSLVSSEQVKN